MASGAAGESTMLQAASLLYVGSHRAFVMGATVLIATSRIAAHWAVPPDAPVDRLVENLNRYIDEHPDDANGYYLLGRVHSLAFALKTDKIGIYEPSGDDGLPRIADRRIQATGYDGARLCHTRWDQAFDRRLPPVDELLGHLAAALENYRKAVSLDADPAQYHLGLAYVLDIGAHLADQVATPAGLDPEAIDVAPKEKNRFEYDVVAIRSGEPRKRWQHNYDELRSGLPKAVGTLVKFRADPDPVRHACVRELLMRFWKDQAIESYYAAYERSIREDLEIKRWPLDGLSSLIGYEAGTALVRLVEERGAADRQEEARVAEVRAAIEKLEAKPLPGAITPIIFSVDRPRRLEELVATDRVVEFDLDGDGEIESWPWVRPRTAILVWDPCRTGRIGSGRQLFGSVTWWMFFPDGYRALDALDDDRNGELSGDELSGLALWFDRNSDGISDPGEVRPIEETAIEAISTRPLSREGDALLNPYGLRLQDGRVLPTYDWVVSPVASEAASVGEPEGLELLRASIQIRKYFYTNYKFV
jgi:hypothetical protein